MERKNKFHTTVTVVPFGKGTIKIEHLTPILTKQEREKRKREINNQLYEVFKKYD